MKECDEELKVLNETVSGLHAQQAAINFHTSVPLSITSAPSSPAIQHVGMSGQPPASPSATSMPPGLASTSGPDPESDDEVQEMVTPMDITPVSDLNDLHHPHFTDGPLLSGLSHEPRVQSTRTVLQSEYPLFLSSSCVSPRSVASIHELSSIRYFPMNASSSQFPFTIIFCVMFLLSCIAFLLPTANAATPFTALTINTNGLANVMKQAAISSTIAAHNPLVWVINETKSFLPVRDRLTTPDHHKFESPGRKLERGPGGKWGVIVGVKRSLHAQPLDVDPRFAGRIVALDAAAARVCPCKSAKRCLTHSASNYV